MILGSLSVFSQGKVVKRNEETYLTPDGLMEDIYDNLGNKLTLYDIKIVPQTVLKSGEIITNTLLCSPGMFDLYFETGSGMENTADATQNARRAVVCKVFEDMSAFVNHPASTRIRIWVRNIASGNTPAGVLGYATAFYNLPVSNSSALNTTLNFGGIADSEVWKTIHTGLDSYTNLILPLESNNAAATNVFYHGMMAFNFGSSYTWNTNLTIDAPAGIYDLYSVVLHEVTHSLGFASLINYNGYSRFSPSNYYSRYDRFLKTNDSSSFLLTTASAVSMYNYKFNNALNINVLTPGCGLVPPISTGHSGLSSCTTALKYVSGIRSIPIYTPVCYENGSSFSHYEDLLYPNCTTPYGNNIYFTLSDVNPPGTTKRYLKSEERLTLCDIGYNVNSTFGTASTFHGTISYPDPVCNGIAVAGLNDGLNSSGTIVYTGNINNLIAINGSGSPIGILANDVTTNIADLRFEGLEDVYFPATISASSGSASTPVNFSSIYPGIHLLRYVPYNNVTQQRGNITYIYVRVTGNCATTPVCNLIKNGDFEQYSSAPSNAGQIIKACGWDNATYRESADYFNSATNPNGYSIPCNNNGYQMDNISPNNHAYAGMYIAPNRSSSVTNAEGVYSESIRTELPVALLPNTTYQLTFDVSMADSQAKKAIKFQAYLSPTELQLSTSGILPTAAINTAYLYTNTVFSANTSGWDRVTFIINTGSATGLKYVYLGGLNNVQFVTLTTSPTPISGCPFTVINQSDAYYYVDNIKLISLATESTLSLPASFCNTQSVPNLNTYLSVVRSGGVFTGPGVSFSGGGYTFSASTLAPGNYTILYTYTNTSNCVISISSDIVVSDCSSSSCPGTLTFITTEPATTATYQAKFTIVTNTNYLVNPGSTITLKAGNSITFSPSSEVKVNSTSNFTAQIADCTQTSQRVMEDENPTKKVSTMIISPNPTNGYTTIRMNDALFNKIIISTIDGRIVYTEVMKETSEYAYDTSNLTKGIYIISIETNDGELISKKLIKK